MLISLVLFVAFAHADPWDEVAVAAEMEVTEVRTLMAGVPKRQSVLDRMASPWEAQPWHKYGPIFLKEDKYAGGVAFWEKHRARLALAEQETGVPAEIIVAIIGVETKWGRVMGNDPIVEALYTLGFFHPRRGTFFRKELGNYLRLATDEGWAIRERKGSYAGAMGMGQFMPSSYRNYAVDGDGDGKRDLFANTDDAIASVANYFVAHGWKRGEPILLDAAGDPAALAGLVQDGMKPTTSWTALSAAGVRVSKAPSADAVGRVFSFETQDGPEYRLGLWNFYVVTRYNHSPLYARAVTDLAVELKARM